MDAVQMTLGIVLLIFSVAIVLVVLLQEGHQHNAGEAGAIKETFYTRNKSRSLEVFLERWTKFIAVGFFLLVIALNAVLFFM